jgi:hypothetical protein
MISRSHFIFAKTPGHVPSTAPSSDGPSAWHAPYWVCRTGYIDVRRLRYCRASAPVHCANSHSVSMHHKEPIDVTYRISVGIVHDNSFRFSAMGRGFLAHRVSRNFAQEACVRRARKGSVPCLSIPTT